jgi:hypothetical protein
VGCRFPDREIEEPWSSSGREEEDPVRADVLLGFNSYMLQAMKGKRLMLATTNI